MKISSRTEICNLALMKIKQAPISDMEADSPQAKNCNLIFEQALSSLLSRACWSFALQSKKLKAIFDREKEIAEIKKKAEDEGDELDESQFNSVKYEYAYGYELPDDFLAVYQIYSGKRLLLDDALSPTPIYIFEHGKIMTNEKDVSIRYVKELDNITDLSPLFINCLTTYIAYLLNPLFEDNVSLRQLLYQEYEMLFEQALAADSKMNLKHCPRFSPLVAQHLGSF